MHKQGYLTIMVITLVVMFLPMLVHPESEFEGTDDKAVAAIEQINPEYKPWINSIIPIENPETERLLFLLQGIVGGTVFGYCVARLKK